MFQSEQYRFPVCGFSQISSSTNQLQVTHNETKQEEKQRKQQRKKTSEPRGALVKSRGEAAENNVLTHASTDNQMFFFGSLSRSGATLRHVWFFCFFSYTSDKISNVFFFLLSHHQLAIIQPSETQHVCTVTVFQHKSTVQGQLQKHDDRITMV